MSFAAPAAPEQLLPIAAGASRSAKGTKPSRLVHAVHTRKAPVANPATTTLQFLCQQVIAAELERYPPASLGVLAPDDWEGLLKMRHAKTTPKEGTGGLDGTGRMAPAVSDKFLHAVEVENSHLAESAVVDRLVWKDCVEARFRRGGLTRARGLLYPWPVLVTRIQEAAAQLTSSPALLLGALKILEETPMNVALLQATGAGKLVRKAVKTLKREGTDDTATARLEFVLKQWMSLADPTQKSSYENDNDDLQVAESTCLSWRQLFGILKQRDENRVSNQGKRMREIRRNLASDRPKVVKVRPSSKKHQRFQAGPIRGATSASAISSSPGANNKISQIRQEAAAVAARQQRGPPSPLRSSFGAAVAVATTGKKKLPPKHRPPPSRHMALAGGKRMQVPSQVVRGAGARQLASKFKTYKK